MRLCIDTSAYAAFQKGHPEVLHVVQRARELAMPVVVLGELFGGFRRGTREPENRRLLREFFRSPRSRVLEVDSETAERYGEIYAHLRDRGTPVPTNDIWIAASAMQHGLRVLTADRHFERVPQVSCLYLSSR